MTPRDTRPDTPRGNPVTPMPNPALWRRIATGDHALDHIDHQDQPALRGYAWAMLKQDHARRLGRDLTTGAPALTGAPGEVIPFTPRQSTTPRHRVTLTPKTEPEDAA